MNRRRAVALGCCVTVAAAVAIFPPTGGTSEARPEPPGSGPDPGAFCGAGPLIPPSTVPAVSPTVWEVVVFPERFVGRTITLTGFADMGFEYSMLLQTWEEVVVAGWRAERHVSYGTFERNLHLTEPNGGRIGMSAECWNRRKVVVRGVVRAPPGSPLEAPLERWKFGVWMDVQSIAAAP